MLVAVGSERIDGPKKSALTAMPMTAMRTNERLEAAPGRTIRSHHMAGAVMTRSNTTAIVSRRGCSGNCRELITAASAASVT